MKAGGGHAKGAQFEREICKALSLWITNGKRTDVFWRTAMSGGRATVAHRKGVDVRQCGDICAVGKEGHELTDAWYMECKFVRKLALGNFIVKGTGPLREYWKEAVTKAVQHKRDPMIIARQNGWPIIVITRHNHLGHITQPFMTLWNVYPSPNTVPIDITFFDSWMRTSNDDGRRVKALSWKNTRTNAKNAR